MERVVLRHLSGSKSNQVQEFPLNNFIEISIGRDPASTLAYDPERDDLVGRQHAKIVRDAADPSQFLVVDLNSRNGTFVNKQRIVGSVRVAPGDVIQFGPGGPEFQFDLDPRPAGAVRQTRLAESGPTAGQNVPATRISGSPPAIPPTGAPGIQHSSVGKATVERMIAQNKSESKKLVLLGGAALIFLLVAVAGFLVYQNIRSKQQLASEIGETRSAVEAAAASAPMSPSQIVDSYSNAVVYFEVGWKLIYTPTGSQIYHLYIPNDLGNGRQIVPDGRAFVAAYVQVDQSTFEPLLTDNSRNGRPIGGEHTGTGFTVTSDGFILTNRHVAATWRTSYIFPPDANPGVVIQGNRIAFRGDGQPLLINSPSDWVPSETKQAGQRLQGGFEGRNDYLNVTFAKNDLRIPSRVARVSDRHDVAMVKIEVPEPVNKVEIFDNYESIKPGDVAVVLGYPAVSPPVFGVTRSQDVFARESKVKIVPDPTVTPGNVGRVIRGQESSDKDPLYSLFGDAYQLTINATGGGNSGGPVFDDRGRVVGIFFASARTDTMITFAVPIRYGKELMSVSASR